MLLEFSLQNSKIFFWSVISYKDFFFLIFKLALFHYILRRNIFLIDCFMLSKQITVQKSHRLSIFTKLKVTEFTFSSILFTREKKLCSCDCRSWSTTHTAVLQTFSITIICNFSANAAAWAEKLKKVLVLLLLNNAQWLLPSLQLSSVGLFATDMQNLL